MFGQGILFFILPELPTRRTDSTQTAVFRAFSIFWLLIQTQVLGSAEGSEIGEKKWVHRLGKKYRS